MAVVGGEGAGAAERAGRQRHDAVDFSPRHFDRDRLVQQAFRDVAKEQPSLSPTTSRSFGRPPGLSRNLPAHPGGQRVFTELAGRHLQRDSLEL